MVQPIDNIEYHYFVFGWVSTYIARERLEEVVYQHQTFNLYVSDSDRSLFKSIPLLMIEKVNMKDIGKQVNCSLLTRLVVNATWQN